MAIIAAERYIMVVHPIWHKNHFRPWWTYTAVAFCWANSVATNTGTYFASTTVIDGQCYTGATFSSPAVAAAVASFTSAFYFLLPLTTFIFCYSRILMVFRRKTSDLFINPNPVAGASAGPASANNNTNSVHYRMQMSATKTTIIVTSIFVVCWAPMNLFNLYSLVSSNVNYNGEVYYSLVLVGFMNVCFNPFIYAGKYDLVKQFARSLVFRCDNRVATESSKPAGMQITVNTIA